MKKRIYKILQKLVLVVICGVVLEATNLTSVVEATYSVEAAKVSAPVVSNIKPGKVVTDDAISIKFKETSGTKIYWSFDGNIYALYDSDYPIEIEKSRTIYAYAVKNGVESEVKTYKYKLVPSLDTSVNEGTYTSAQTIKLNSVDGAKIYYTLNGKKPTTKSKKYTKSGITIDSSCTLRVMVKKSGWTTGYYEFTYNIEATDMFETINDYTQKPMYNTLNKNEKAVYQAIYEGFASFASETKDLLEYKISLSKAKEIFRYVICENPQLFWANDGKYNASYPSGSSYVKKIMLYYTNDREDALTRQKKLQNKAKKIIEEANKKTDNLFDYCVYLHDKICEITTYDKSNSSNRETAGTDDIFVDGRGLCTAYARAFSYLCQLSGIDCVNIEGNAVSVSGGYVKTEGHCWNKVKLGGKWYNVDVCWDDQDEPVYNYFCVTDEKIRIDHYEDSFFDSLGFVATATKYNYLTYMGITEYQDANSAYQALISGIVEQIISQGYCNVTIYYVPSVNYAISTAIDRRLAGTDGSGMDIWKDIQSVSPEAYKKLTSKGASVSWNYSSGRIQLEITMK